MDHVGTPRNYGVRIRRWLLAALRVVGRSAWIVASVVLMIATGISWTTFQDLSGGLPRSAAIAADAPKSVGAVNILLIGLSTRLGLNGEELPDDQLKRLNAGESDRGGYNANTLMLLHIPDNGSGATALSIPRDNYVDFAGLPGGPRQGKIKEAYGRAKELTEARLVAGGFSDRRELERRGREAGRRAQVDTVRAFLNVPVDHLAELSLNSFYDVADALGGVTVCLNQPAKDSFSGADFPAGPQHLSAAQALSFVRQRHGLTGGDLDRTRRQQAFIAAVTHQVKNSSALSNLDTLGKLLEAAKKNIVVDEGLDIQGLAGRAAALAGGKLAFHTLPIEGIEQVDGQAVNRVDKTRIQSMVTDLFGPQVPGAPRLAPGAGPPQPAPGIPCVD